MKNRIRISLLALLPLLLFFGCTDKNAYKKVDVSKINVDLPLQHFEHDFFDFNAENFEAHDAMMQQKYGSFYQLLHAADYVFRYAKIQWRYS
jgi:hypothetical protein